MFAGDSFEKRENQNTTTDPIVLRLELDCMVYLRGEGGGGSKKLLTRTFGAKTLRPRNIKSKGVFMLLTKPICIFTSFCNLSEKDTNTFFYIFVKGLQAYSRSVLLTMSVLKLMSMLLAMSLAHDLMANYRFSMVVCFQDLASIFIGIY